MMNSRQIKQALSGHRYETARRLAEQAIRQGNDSFGLRVDLHAAYCRLGDYDNARETLNTATAGTSDDAFTLAILLAEDYYKLANGGHYRKSPEALAGLCIDEYLAKYPAAPCRKAGNLSDILGAGES